MHTISTEVLIEHAGNDRVFDEAQLAAAAFCQRSRTRGDHAGDVFICAECQDDAKQLIDIQDSIWVEANEAGDATGDTDK